MRHIVFRLFAALVLVAAIAGVGVLAYNAGVSHQAAFSATTPSAQTGSPAYPVYGPFWWPFPFFGFGFFGLLAVFFLFAIAFSALRFVLWGPRFGWRRMGHRYGRWWDEGSGEGIPPMFTEMHRRMHEADEGQSADPATQK